MNLRISWITLITLAALILVFAPLWGVAGELHPVKYSITNPE